MAGPDMNDDIFGYKWFWVSFSKAHSGTEDAKLAPRPAPPRPSAAIRRLPAMRRLELTRSSGPPMSCQKRCSPWRSHIRRIRQPVSPRRPQTGKACGARAAAARSFSASTGYCSIDC
jgi:hypothetical protein